MHKSYVGECLTRDETVYMGSPAREQEESATCLDVKSLNFLCLPGERYRLAFGPLACRETCPQLERNISSYLRSSILYAELSPRIPHGGVQGNILLYLFAIPHITTKWCSVYSYRYLPCTQQERQDNATLVYVVHFQINFFPRNFYFHHVVSHPPLTIIRSFRKDDRTSTIVRQSTNYFDFFVGWLCGWYSATSKKVS